MFTALIASAAVLASTAYAGSPGSAVVINACSYDVYLSSVPAQYGGYDTTQHTLSPGQTYQQQWTSLSNGAGWSIKLAKQQGASSIMQYEYTYQNDGTIWYDLSNVDGNPWEKNWEITAAGDSSCSPRQAAYRYATDDAYGMQSCNAGASVTVTLCSGESKNDGLVSAIQSAVEAPLTVIASHFQNAPAATAPTTTSTSTTTPAPAPTTPTTSVAAAPAHTEHTTSNGKPLNYNGGNFFNEKAQGTATTFATFATGATTPVAVVVGHKHNDATDEDVVTVYQTVVETATAYETYVPGKRHVHHPDHPQFR